MSYKGNYSVVVDEQEFNKFLRWLPPLEKEECHYVALLARDKYIRDLGIGTFNSDKHQCARFTTTHERLLLKLKQCETEIGNYAVNGTCVPQEALAAYMTINPRSQTKAAKWLLKRLADVVADEEQNVNVYQESLTAIHKSIGRKLFVDVDFDNVPLAPTVRMMSGFVNSDAVKILETRGGFHAIIRLDAIEEKYVKSWYKNITSLEGADIAGDTLIPIPGTYQGGFVPTLFDMKEFL